MIGIAQRRRARILAEGEVLALPLEDALRENGDLVLRRRLPGQPLRDVAHELIEDALDDLPVGRDEFFRHICHGFIGRRMTRCAEEPQPVAQDGPTDRDVEILDVRNAVRALDAARPERVVDIVGLPGSVGAADEQRAAEDVAAVLGDAVHADPATGILRWERARRDTDLGLQRVIEIAHAHAILVAVDRHAVDELHRLALVDPVHAHGRLLHRARAADVGRAESDAWHQNPDRHDVARRRQRVDDLAGQHLRLRRLLHVDER